MKDCRNIREELSAYVDNELTPAARTDVETHLASCAGCREELAEMKTLALGVAALAKLQHAPRFLYEVRHKIARGENPEALTWQDYLLRPYWFKIPLEVAALIIICLALQGEHPAPTGKDARLAMAKVENAEGGRVAANSTESAPAAPSANERSFDGAKQGAPAEVDSVRPVAQAPKDEVLASSERNEAKTLVIAGATDQRQLLDRTAISGAITPGLEEKPTIGARRIPANPGNEPAVPPLAPLSGAASAVQNIASAQSKLSETIVLHARDLTEARNRAQQLATRCRGRIVAVADATVFVELPKEYAAAFKLELLKTPETSATKAIGAGSGSGVLTGSASTNSPVSDLIPLGLRDEANDTTATTFLEIRVVVPSN